VKQEIIKLIEISRFYGENKEFVIAGGGNTSFKTESTLWIKASGTSLNNITEEGFVSLNRHYLNKISSKKYSKDVTKREDEVKNDLAASKTDTSSELRPSVEAMLHHIIPHSFVVHTHSTIGNALLCSNDVEKVIPELFGNKVLYIPYTDPGYLLYKKTEEELEKHLEKTGYYPKIILLQNHGVFVSGENINEIKQIYDFLISTVNNKITRDIVTTENPLPDAFIKLIPKLIEKFQEYSFFTVRNTKLYDYFLQNSQTFQGISKPFTPDIIVYCKSKYLYIEDNWQDTDKVFSKISYFHVKNHYYPKIILIKGVGVVSLEVSQEKADSVADVFLDMAKIGFLSKDFGGPHFMNKKQISFIENWEVEHYRKKVFDKS